MRDPVAIMVRLGGEYERASINRDTTRMVAVDSQIQQLAQTLDENMAWWNLVIRGRNIIRRYRQLDEVHY